jgi:hypothetical protein
MGSEHCAPGLIASFSSTSPLAVKYQFFEAYRELIEQVASDAYDAGTSFNDAGLVLVTSEGLARVGRSA